MVKPGERLLEGVNVEISKIQEVTPLTPTSKGSIFNTSVTANTDIFASPLKPQKTPCLFRIYVCFDTAGVLTVRRTKGDVTVNEKLKEGTNLVAGAAYIFDIIVDADEAINLQYSVNATALKISVVELETAGA
ncbi:MAG: hypothetical protein QXH03_02740 [Candidatus Bathyarchaeia archaeon]